MVAAHHISNCLKPAGEVHADPDASRLGLLGNAVQPVTLAPAAHHYKVSARRGQRDAAPAVPGLKQEPSGGPQAQHRNDALIALAGGPVAVPASAVAVIAVQVYPQAVIGHRVMLGQGCGNRAEHRHRRVGNTAVLGGEPGFEYPLVVYQPIPLFPFGCHEDIREQLIAAGQPPGDVLDPGRRVQVDAMRTGERSVYGYFSVREQVRLVLASRIRRNFRR
jgi:hypothetical protein